MPSEREVRRVLARFAREGWQCENGKSSHVVLRKAGATISVPTLRKELVPGTYGQIARLAGWRQGDAGGRS